VVFYGDTKGFLRGWNARRFRNLSSSDAQIRRPLSARFDAASARHRSFVAERRPVFPDGSPLGHFFKPGKASPASLMQVD
jgi:hypothetical protein